MSHQLLTQSQIEQFVEQGYVMLPGAFSREVAAECRQFLWNKIGLSENDPTGWTKHMIRLNECFEGPPFDRLITPRVEAAFDDLMGKGRWEPRHDFGWWPIVFPGFEHKPWQPPTQGWHVDGQHFHHHVNSREQGLLPLFIFSDIDVGDGGTAIAPGSHKPIARLLAAAEPQGIAYKTLGELCQSVPRPHVLESTGRAGDVVLIHPFMLHARSMNTGPKVRMICNPAIALNEKMNLQRENPNDYPPVERAIVQAIKQPASVS